MCCNPARRSSTMVYVFMLRKSSAGACCKLNLNCPRRLPTIGRKQAARQLKAYVGLRSHKKTAAETSSSVQPHPGQRESAFVRQRRQIFAIVFVSVLHVDSFALLEGHRHL